MAKQLFGLTVDDAVATDDVPGVIRPHSDVAQPRNSSRLRSRAGHEEVVHQQAVIAKALRDGQRGRCTKLIPTRQSERRARNSSQATQRSGSDPASIEPHTATIRQAD